MDPFSVSVGALQIASLCTGATVTIIKWVGDVRTVDARIRGFYDEILALSSTYEGLEESLRSPLMIEAARVANQSSDGAHLWNQVRIALDDSTKTMNRVRTILDEISRHTGPLKSVKKQLTESLSNGELSRLRQRIQFFNNTISLPIQMVCVMLQLEQRGISADHQKKLDSKFMSLERTMRDLIRQLSQPSRTSTIMTGSTLIVGATTESDDVRGKDSYLNFAKKILSTASAAASTRSSLSTVSPQIDAPPLSELGTGPVPYSSQNQHDRRIPDWIPAPAQHTPNSLAELHSPAGLGPGVPPESPQPRGKSYEVSYKLAHTHLKLGQEKVEQENHESAEKSFRKALDLLAKHDFSGRIAFQPAEVVLMLAQSCIEQKKYTEAIDLLKPVAARENNIFPSDSDGRSLEASSTGSSIQPDTLLALAASHMLGEVYRQQGDFEEAKTHALKAFLTRMDELGEHDEKTLESVRLVIEVYRGMGDEEEAEAYEAFLTPTTPAERNVPNQSLRQIGTTEDETAVASMSPPPSEVNTTSPTLHTMTSLQTLPTQPNKSGRPSLASRFRKIGKTSQPTMESKRSSSSEIHRHSFTRASTLDDAYHISVFLPPTKTETRHVSSHSETSNDRTNSFVDIASTAPSSTRLERTPSIKTLEPTFQAISQLCVEGKTSKAGKLAMSFLEGYGSNNFIIRREAMEKNIREGGKKGLSATGHGYAPIHFFCELKEEFVDEVNLLLRYGADVNCIAYKAGYTGSVSSDTLTPLHLAIKKGHTAIAKLLLDDKNIKVDVPNGDGFVPLLAACRRRNYPVVQTLLSKHAPKCIPRSFPTAWYGNSTLHDAARHCDAKLVEMLLLSGHCDINQQDDFGKTPLMHAVVKSDVSDPSAKARMVSERVATVGKLLEAGADGNLVDNHGVTARGYAHKERKEEGRDVLLTMLGEVRYEMG